MDYQVFTFIHGLSHALLFEWIALWLSGIGAGGLIWLLISLWLFIREEKRDRFFFLPVVLATTLSYLVTDMVLKNIFMRARPPGATLTDYSFPSGHATFAWALAFVLALKEPRSRYYFFLLAILISVSRVYLGEHYPSDVLAGAFLGIIIGWLSIMLENFARKKWIRPRARRSKKIR